MFDSFTSLFTNKFFCNNLNKLYMWRMPFLSSSLSLSARNNEVVPYSQLLHLQESWFPFSFSCHSFLRLCFSEPLRRWLLLPSTSVSACDLVLIQIHVSRALPALSWGICSWFIRNEGTTWAFLQRNCPQFTQSISHCNYKAAKHHVTGVQCFT